MCTGPVLLVGVHWARTAGRCVIPARRGVIPARRGVIPAQECEMFMTVLGLFAIGFGFIPEGFLRGVSARYSSLFSPERTIMPKPAYKPGGREASREVYPGL